MYNKIYYVPKLPIASILPRDQSKRIPSSLLENETIMPVNRGDDVKIGIVNFITPCIGRVCFIRKVKNEFTAILRYLKNCLINVVLIKVIRAYIELGRQVVDPVNYVKRNVLGYTWAIIRHTRIK